MRFQPVRIQTVLRSRLAGVVAVWMMAAITLGMTLHSPLAIAIMTVAILILTLVFEASADVGAGAVALSMPAGSAAEMPSGDATFARHFVAKEFAAARRGRKLTLVMFGLSRLEEFTAQRGPGAAADALREFGHVLQQMTRQMNLSSRCGWRADAFLSVLADADVDAAQAFISRVRAAAAASSVPMPDIEAGITVYQPHLASPEEFVECAERSLAAARAAARNVPRPGTSAPAYGARARRLQTR